MKCRGDTLEKQLISFCLPPLCFCLPLPLFLFAPTLRSGQTKTHPPPHWEALVGFQPLGCEAKDYLFVPWLGFSMSVCQSSAKVLAL
jgi:hypothetical protein